MGVVLSVGRSRFTMAPDMESSALAALKKENAREGFSVCLVGNRDELDQSVSFEEAMLALGWRLRRHAGKIRGLNWVHEKSSSDEQVRLFKTVAHCVDSGSFIEMTDDSSNDHYRLEFNGRALRRRRIDTIGAQEDVLEEQDAADARASWRPPTFASVKGSMPAAREPYRVGVTVRVGGWIEHSTFGPGLVIRAEGSNKAMVLFAPGTKILSVGRCEER